MRLDIGPGGKIIGTKRVSPNGQVSGLSEYTGREVLIVLLEDGANAAPTGAGGPSAWTDAVNEQMRRAFEQYESLQDLYSTPWEATRAFLQSVFPWAPLPGLTEQVQRWIQSQMSRPAPATPSPSDGRDFSGPAEGHPSHAGTQKTGPRARDATRRRGRKRT
jgi:hypothetical protein